MRKKPMPRLAWILAASLMLYPIVSLSNESPPVIELLELSPKEQENLGNYIRECEMIKAMDATPCSVYSKSGIEWMDVVSISAITFLIGFIAGVSR